MPAAAVYDIANSNDPLTEMLQRIGDISTVDLAGGRVLLWSYVRPRKTKGGIILTDSQAKEDVWQATVGYILKLGPLAFKNDAKNDFGGFHPKVGDWVVFTPGEGKRRQINGVDCRVIEDALIEMRVADPDIITHRT